jgi:NTP pyrophosphatase (non-canonical NTP hydrolase)
MKVREFQAMLTAIYGDTNADRKWDYAFGYLSRTSGYLGKAVKKKAANPIDFFRPLSWLSAMATHHDIPLQEAFFRRYPGICPYCVEFTCICRRTGKQPRGYLAAYKIEERLASQYNTFLNVENSPSQTIVIFSIAHATDVIRRVYPANEIVWFHAGPSYHFGKVHEEVAEIHEAVSRFDRNQKPKSAVADEIGDVFAWLISAWDIYYPDRQLEEDLKSYYLKGCPVCGQPKCVCGDRDDRPDGLIDTESLTAILKVIKGLEDIFGGDRFADLRRSLERAIASQNQPVARASVINAAALAEELATEATSHSKPEEASRLLQRLTLLVRRATPFADIDGM